MLAGKQRRKGVQISMNTRTKADAKSRDEAIDREHDPDRLLDVQPNAERLTLREVVERERSDAAKRREQRKAMSK